MRHIDPKTLPRKAWPGPDQASARGFGTLETPLWDREDASDIGSIMILGRIERARAMRRFSRALRRRVARLIALPTRPVHPTARHSWR